MNGAEDMNRDHERVSAYLGGMMTPQEAAAFEQEIGGNSELASLVERWRGNDALLKKAGCRKPALRTMSWRSTASATGVALKMTIRHRRSGAGQ
jgi:anti-sigma-K factor RskA